LKIIILTLSTIVFEKSAIIYANESITVNRGIAREISVIIIRWRWIIVLLYQNMISFLILV